MKNDSTALFRQTLEADAGLRGTDLSARQLDAFCSYFGLVLKWNPQLHLTSITDPVIFARRHIGESAFAVGLLQNSVNRVLDIGSGMGIPGLPFAILRPDIRVHLVEANRRKAVFLREAADILNLSGVSVENSRFDSSATFAAQDCITARAVENMRQVVDEILLTGGRAAQMLLFVSAELSRHLLRSCDRDYAVSRHLLPFSDDRWVVSAVRFT